MRIQDLMRSGTGLLLSIALLALLGLGVVACHESEGTKQIPGTYPPESEINRNYPPPPPPEPDAGTGTAGTGTEADAGPDAGDASLAP